jgi:hypothetical protein
MFTGLITAAGAVLVMAAATPAANAVPTTTPITYCSDMKKAGQTNLYIVACATRHHPGPWTYGQVMVKNYGSVPIHVAELRVRMVNDDVVGGFVTCPIHEAIDPGELRGCVGDLFSSWQPAHANGQLNYSNGGPAAWVSVDSPPVAV